MKVIDLIRMCNNIIQNTRIFMYTYDESTNAYKEIGEFDSYKDIHNYDKNMLERKVSSFTVFDTNDVDIVVI